MKLTEVVTAPRSPWQNAYVERVIGSMRRECMDHIVIFNERHLRRVLSSYVDFYKEHGRIFYCYRIESMERIALQSECQTVPPNREPETSDTEIFSRRP